MRSSDICIAASDQADQAVLTRFRPIGHAAIKQNNAFVCAHTLRLGEVVHRNGRQKDDDHAWLASRKNAVRPGQRIERLLTIEHSNQHRIRHRRQLPRIGHHRRRARHALGRFGADVIDR
jgi:hypothetical protein